MLDKDAIKIKIKNKFYIGIKNIIQDHNMNIDTIDKYTIKKDIFDDIINDPNIDAAVNIILDVIADKICEGVRE